MSQKLSNANYVELLKGVRDSWLCCRSHANHFFQISPSDLYRSKIIRILSVINSDDIAESYLSTVGGALTGLFINYGKMFHSSHHIKICLHWVCSSQKLIADKTLIEFIAGFNGLWNLKSQSETAQHKTNSTVLIKTCAVLFKAEKSSLLGQ